MIVERRHYFEIFIKNERNINNIYYQYNLYGYEINCHN